MWISGGVIALPALLFAQTYIIGEHTYRTVCILQWPDGMTGLSNIEFMYDLKRNLFLNNFIYQFVKTSVRQTLYTKESMK